MKPWIQKKRQQENGYGYGYGYGSLLAELTQQASMLRRR
jgi:hypothetical protein